MLRKFCSVESSNWLVLCTVLFSVAEGISGEICPTASLFVGGTFAACAGGAGFVVGGCFLALVTPWCLFFGFGGSGFGIVVEASGSGGCVAVGLADAPGAIVGGAGWAVVVGACAWGGGRVGFFFLHPGRNSNATAKSVAMIPRVNCVTFMLRIAPPGDLAQAAVPPWPAAMLDKTWCPRPHACRSVWTHYATAGCGRSWPDQCRCHSFWS